MAGRVQYVLSKRGELQELAVPFLGFELADATHDAVQLGDCGSVRKIICRRHSGLHVGQVRAQRAACLPQYAAFGVGERRRARETHFIIEPAELVPACNHKLRELLRSLRDTINFNVVQLGQRNLVDPPVNLAKLGMRTVDRLLQRLNLLLA